MKSRPLTYVLTGIIGMGLAAAGCQGNRELDRLTKAQASSMSNLVWPTDYCKAFEWYDDGTCDSFCPQPDGDCAKDSCGASTAWHCFGGRVCDRHSCGSDSPGVCVELTDSPFEVSAPVCGCDGITYFSEKARLRAGVARNHVGSCQAGIPECGHWTNAGCSGNRVCDVLSCSSIAGGDCVELPQMCTPEYQPVCGCDGATYPNDCERLLAGVARDHHGECPDVNYHCGPGSACPMDLLCDIRSCDPGASGRCVPKHALRSGNVSDSAVCGCDGNTYASDLERITSGAALDYPGECRTNLTCDVQTDSCPDTMMCNLLSCGPDASGQCVTPVQACLDSQAPVCGCDGLTYLNDCLRIQAGVARDHLGECLDPNRGCGPWEGGECDEGMVCDIAGCDEGLGGECVRRPDLCPMLYDPVCACNGVTYGNNCARLMQGIPLDHEGPCQTP